MARSAKPLPLESPFGASSGMVFSSHLGNSLEEAAHRALLVSTKQYLTVQAHVLQVLDHLVHDPLLALALSRDDMSNQELALTASPD